MAGFPFASHADTESNRAMMTQTVYGPGLTLLVTVDERFLWLDLSTDEEAVEFHRQAECEVLFQPKDGQGWPCGSLVRLGQSRVNLRTGLLPGRLSGSARLLRPATGTVLQQCYFRVTGVN